MAKYRRRLARVEARDPFHHFQRALLVEKQQKFAEAARHYDRAIDLHGGEHRFHFGLARMQMALGQEKRARRSLERASALSRGDAHARYITKLKRMRSMRS
jgi:Flp pilus assembly protein TadD